MHGANRAAVESWADRRTDLVADGMQYCIVANENGFGGETPHIHLYVVMRASTRTSTFIQQLRTAFPGVNPHVETAYATDARNIAYAKKEGDFKVYGDLDVDQTEAYQSRTDANRSRFDEAIELAKSGRMQEIAADLRLRHHRALVDIADEVPEPKENLKHQCGLWVWGPVGTGKTTCVRLAVEGISWEKPLNKWWDKYRGEKYVIVDEMSKSAATTLMTELKIWGDPGVFTAERKGSSLRIRPTCIIVTANWSIDQMYTDPIDRAAMHKRYKELHFARRFQYSPEAMLGILIFITVPKFPVIVIIPFPGESNDSMKRISPPTEVQAKPVTTPATSLFSYLSLSNLGTPKTFIMSSSVTFLL